MSTWLMGLGWMVMSWQAPAGVQGVARQAAAAALPTYQWLHAHPELSGEEEQTAARLVTALRALGVAVHTDIGGHGIVAVVQNRRAPEGPTVLYRADMDALPVQERTNLPYASTRPGVMHACGHDLHMATALAVVQTLRAREDVWRGTLLLVLQPAEETTQGARRMLDDAAFKKVLTGLPKIAVALAWHDDALLPAGTVGLGSGPITANVDGLDITLHGRGGHGAKPQQGIDAVVMAADTVMTLQTIVARRVAPGTKAVVTVGQLEAGTKRNIIAQSALLRLTVRSYEPEVRQRLLGDIRTIVEHVSAAHHAPAAPDIVASEAATPSVVNDPVWTARLTEVLADALGSEHVAAAEQSMGGEDFSLFSELGAPIVLLRLGAAPAAALAHGITDDLPGLHSDRWAPDALPALEVGAWGMALMVAQATSRL